MPWKYMIKNQQCYLFKLHDVNIFLSGKIVNLITFSLFVCFTFFSLKLSQVVIQFGLTFLFVIFTVFYRSNKVNC